jgi:hypothetical protein
VALLRADPPQADGWLRDLFGQVFGVAAIALAAALGVPAGIGLWSMAGATSEGVEPALGRLARMPLVGIAIATTLLTAFAVARSGTSVLVLNLGLVGLVALGALGLAGATASSPHRGRAALSGFVLLAVVAGTLWVLVRSPGYAPA